MTNKEKLTISLSSLSVFLFFVTMQLTTWIPLRFWKIWSGQNFFDLNLVLFWASCFNKYGNFIFEKPLDQTQCTGYIYGSSLIKTLAYFKLNSRDTLVIGYFFMFLLSLVISFVAMKAWGGGGV